MEVKWREVDFPPSSGGPRCLVIRHSEGICEKVPKWRQGTRFGGVGLRSGFPSAVLLPRGRRVVFPLWLLGSPAGKWFVAAKRQSWDRQPGQRC